MRTTLKALLCSCLISSSAFASTAASSSSSGSADDLIFSSQNKSMSQSSVQQFVSSSSSSAAESTNVLSAAASVYSASSNRSSSALYSSSSSSMTVARPIPQIARGYEEIYQRFLKGALVYRPLGSDLGKIELPIAKLANPLEGTFDLSSCGDTGNYLSIATGYRRGKKTENANKLEIWITPRFLIEKELTTNAGHFREIMNKWPTTAPVGLFWTWGGWDKLEWMTYLTDEPMSALDSNDLHKKLWRAHPACPWQLSPGQPLVLGMPNGFMFRFDNLATSCRRIEPYSIRT